MLLDPEQVERNGSGVVGFKKFRALVEKPRLLAGKPVVRGARLFEVRAQPIEEQLAQCVSCV